MHRDGGRIGHQIADADEIIQLELRCAFNRNGQQPGHIGGADSMPIRARPRHRRERYFTTCARAVHHHH